MLLLLLLVMVLDVHLLLDMMMLGDLRVPHLRRGPRHRMSGMSLLKGLVRRDRSLLMRLLGLIPTRAVLVRMLALRTTHRGALDHPPLALTMRSRMLVSHERARGARWSDARRGVDDVRRGGWRGLFPATAAAAHDGERG